MLKYLLFAVFVAASFSPAMANQTDPEIETDDVEQLPNKKLERRGERMRGPITAIGPAGLMLASFDKNSDYSITREEFTKGRDQAFALADKDKSKTLSLFELEDWRKKALGSLDATPGNFVFDKDFDQRVTRLEFNRALDFVFMGADKDKDSSLAFSELVSVFEMPRRPVVEEDIDRLEEIGSRRPRQADRGRRR